MGIFSLIAKEKAKKDDPPCFIMRMREAVLLGAALAVNCVPVAFGAGLTGISPFAASISVGLSSVATVYIGNKIGLVASPNVNERVLSCIGGITLVLLGTLEMFI